jgi:TolA-binding protein
VRHTTRLLVLALIAGPAILPAQRKEDFQQIQRDLAQLEENVRQLQKSNDEKIDALRALLQQAVEASAKTNASMTALQGSLSTALGEQQKTVIDRVVTLGTKVDSMSNDFSSVSTAVQELSRQLGRLDGKLNDIMTAVTVQKEPVAPPPAAGAPQGATSLTPSTPAVSAVSLRQDAERDYSTSKNDLAMSEFVNYVKLFPDDAYAPTAQYYIGMLYDRVGQYDDAAQAFDAVVERFPKNPKTCEAFYMKGVELMKASHRTEASSTFKDYIESCPADSHVTDAQKHRRELGMSVPGSKAGKAKQKK